VIDCLVYKVESYDSDNFKKRLEQYSPRSILLLYNYRSGVRDNGRTIFRFKRNLVWNFAGVFFVLLYYVLRFRPKVLIVENTYDTAFIGIVRSLGLVKKLVYICGDWLLNPLFPFLDYLACKHSDIVWDVTEDIRESRFHCWSRDIFKKEFIYKIRLEEKPSILCSQKNKIVFMGGIRKDSGIELAIPPKGFNLKILPFTKREDLPREFSDCLCGINLITSKHCYTTKCIPGKFLDYVQHGLPVIFTRNCGYVAEVIEDNDVGVVIRPNIKEFQAAVDYICFNQERFRRNIKILISKWNGLTIEEIINGN
jgi:glycosyltransferase involved in cell wall biosynthesis